jgi:hypothetical protein
MNVDAGAYLSFKIMWKAYHPWLWIPASLPGYDDVFGAN